MSVNVSQNNYKALASDWDNQQNDDQLFPGLVSDELLAKMPPTAIFTSELDFLLRDCVNFAERLNKHGKLIGISNMPGTTHCYWGMHFETKETLGFYEDEKLAFDSYILDKPIPEYSLHYFPFYGRREAVAMMLSHAGVAFKEVNYSDDEWTKAKPEMPNGQVPALEFKDGTMLG